MLRQRSLSGSISGDLGHHYLGRQWCLDPWHRFSESESEDSADLQKDELPKSPDSLRFVYG